MALNADQRALRKMRAGLKELTESVGGFLVRIDAEMKHHSSPERGARIAELTNALEMANDMARYFALGIDYRKDKKVT